jgi:hypothetical protein
MEQPEGRDMDQAVVEDMEQPEGRDMDQAGGEDMEQPEGFFICISLKYSNDM